MSTIDVLTCNQMSAHSGRVKQLQLEIDQQQRHSIAPYNAGGSQSPSMSAIPSALRAAQAFRASLPPETPLPPDVEDMQEQQARADAKLEMELSLCKQRLRQTDQEVLDLRKRLLQAEMSASAKAQEADYQQRSQQHALMNAETEIARLKANAKMLAQQIQTTKEQVRTRLVCPHLHLLLVPNSACPIASVRVVLVGNRMH